MPRLAAFLKDEIHRRDWSVEDLARRAGISTSLAYQIVRDGKDNVRQDTLARLASALSMSPAELQVAAGGGPADSDPDEIALLAYWRETTPLKRDTLLEIAASLRAKVHPPTHANPRRDARAKRFLAEEDKLRRPTDDESPQGPEVTLPEYYPPLSRHGIGHRGALAPLLAR